METDVEEIAASITNLNGLSMAHPHSFPHTQSSVLWIEKGIESEKRQRMNILLCAWITERWKGRWVCLIEFLSDKLPSNKYHYP